jgi:hypothetical protein
VQKKKKENLKKKNKKRKQKEKKLLKSKTDIKPKEGVAVAENEEMKIEGKESVVSEKK